MTIKSISILMILMLVSSCSILGDSFRSGDDQNELRMSEQALETLYKRHGITHRNVVEVQIPKPKKKNSRVSEEVLIDDSGKEVK